MSARKEEQIQVLDFLGEIIAAINNPEEIDPYHMTMETYLHIRKIKLPMQKEIEGRESFHALSEESQAHFQESCYTLDYG